MADTNLFNPDVENVGVPNELGATRPISRPESNKAYEVLGRGVGEAFKDAGDIYKEAIKVTDYTNKKFEEGQLQAGLGAIREDQIAKQQAVNWGFTGVDPAKMPGMRGFSGDDTPLTTGGIDPSAMPPQLTNQFVNKAATLAAARVNQNQLDLYYKGRIDSLLKEHRAAYPEYRDYIDKVAEKYGFGNSANEYLHSLTRANMAIQQQLAAAQGTDAMKPRIEEAIQKSWVTAEKGDAAMRGDPVARQEVLSAYTREAASKNTFTQNVERIAAGESSAKANKDEATRVVTERMESRLAMRLKSGTEGSGGFAKAVEDARALDGNTDPNVVAETLNRYNKEFAQLSFEMDQDADEPVQARRINPITGQAELIKTTPKALMGGDSAYKQAKDAVLQRFTDLHTAMGAGKFTVANAASNEIQAKQQSVLKRLFSNDAAATLLTLDKELKDNSEAMRAFMSKLYDPQNEIAKKVGSDAFGLWTNRAVAIVKGSEGASKTLNEVKPANSPELNKAIINMVRDGANQGYTPQMRKNIFNAFFGPKEQGDNSILKKITDPNQRTMLYQNMTHPDMVAEARKQGGDVWNHYYDYVTNEFGESLFKKDISDIENFQFSSIPGFKVTYNNKDNKYDVDIGKDKQVLNTNYNLPGTDEVANTYLKRHVFPALRRINAGIEGLKNVHQGDKEKVDGDLHRLLQGLDRDRETEGPSAFESAFNAAGGIAKRMLNALNSTNEANIKLMEQAAEKRRKFLESNKE